MPVVFIKFYAGTWNGIRIILRQLFCMGWTLTRIVVDKVELAPVEKIENFITHLKYLMD